MATTANNPPAIIPGRNCNGCALCCKLPNIPALNKPADQWCNFCSTRKQCDAYDTRPQECADFHCMYLTSAQVGEEWKPLKSRMLLISGEDGKRLTMIVDPARPDAWKQEPYYSQLKAWARFGEKNGTHILVSVNRRVFVIYGNRDVDLGVISETDSVSVNAKGDSIQRAASDATET